MGYGNNATLVKVQIFLIQHRHSVGSENNFIQEPSSEKKAIDIFACCSTGVPRSEETAPPQKASAGP